MKKVFLKTTHSKQFQFSITMLFVVVVAVITSACSNDDNQASVRQETPAVAITEIAQDIKDIIYFQGAEKAPTVLIVIPGGPSIEFDQDIVDLVAATTDTTDLLMLNVHQAQTLDSTIVKGVDITLDQAVDFTAESIEMLDKVTSYFKGQGRTVYVLGFSFGAFVTQELIAKKGIDSADKYLMISGRLDMNDVLWQAYSEGRDGWFENDGITPVIATDLDPDVKERNLIRLSAALGMNRYTQLFDSIEDLSNITYVYGEADEAVGSLTAEEVQFLESKNTTIFSGSGGHGYTFFEFIEQAMKETFNIELVL